MPQETSVESSDRPKVKPFPLPEGAVETLLYDVQLANGNLTTGPCAVSLYRNLKSAQQVPFSHLSYPSFESREMSNSVPTAVACLPRGEEFAFVVNAHAALQGRMSSQEGSLSTQLGLLGRDGHSQPLFITQEGEELSEEIAGFRAASGDSRYVIVNNRILNIPSMILAADGRSTHGRQDAQPLIFDRAREEEVIAEIPLEQQFLLIVLLHARAELLSTALAERAATVRRESSALLAGGATKPVFELPPLRIAETRPIAAFHVTLVEELASLTEE